MSSGSPPDAKTSGPRRSGRIAAKRPGEGAEPVPKKRKERTRAAGYVEWLKEDRSRITPDIIAWFVDVCGADSVVRAVLDASGLPYVSLDMSKKESREHPGGKKIRAALKAGRGRKAFGCDVEDGVYFLDGHWYCVKDKKRYDSYTEGYQRKGSEGFCQSFALMIYLGKIRDLKPGNNRLNIVLALEFWGTLLCATGQMNIFIKAAKESPKFVEGLTERELEFLRRISQRQLRAFIALVNDNAGTFI